MNFSYKDIVSDTNSFFGADCCNKGYHTSSTAGGIQWCVYCIWIDGYWFASNYSFKSSFVRGALSGTCFIQSKKCTITVSYFFSCCVGVARNLLSSIFCEFLVYLGLFNLIYPKLSGYSNIDKEHKVSTAVDKYLGILKYYWKFVFDGVCYCLMASAFNVPQAGNLVKTHICLYAIYQRSFYLWPQENLL